MSVRSLLAIGTLAPLRRISKTPYGTVSCITFALIPKTRLCPLVTLQRKQRTVCINTTITCGSVTPQPRILRLYRQKTGTSPKDIPETQVETRSYLLTSLLNPDITRFDLKFPPEKTKGFLHTW